MQVAKDDDQASASRAALLKRFNELAADYTSGRFNAIGLLNIGDVGFGVASKLIPALVARIEQLEACDAIIARDARALAQSLDRWQRWVVSVAADGARVIAHASIAGDVRFYRVGDTFYMGGDPDVDRKAEAVSSLIALGVFAELPRRDIYATRQRDWCYRLTDFGAEVAVHLADVMIDEDGRLAAEEEAEHAD